jgi:hypothetical protein
MSKFRKIGLFFLLFYYMTNVSLSADELSEKRALVLSQVVEALGDYAKVEKTQIFDAKDAAINALIENIGHVVSEANQAKILREKVLKREAEILAERQRIAEARQILAQKDTEIENLLQKLAQAQEEIKTLKNK